MLQTSHVSVTGTVSIAIQCPVMLSAMRTQVHKEMGQGFVFFFTDPLQILDSKDSRTVQYACGRVFMLVGGM